MGDVDLFLDKPTTEAKDADVKQDEGMRTVGKISGTKKIVP